MLHPTPLQDSPLSRTKINVVIIATVLFHALFSYVRASSSSPYEGTWYATVAPWLRMLWLVPLVGQAISLAGWVWLGAPRFVKEPGEEKVLNHIGGKHFYYRYTTRGTHRDMVVQNAAATAEVLGSLLPMDSFTVEIVSDLPINVPDELQQANVVEIRVPKSYTTPKGTLFKARAMNYAVYNSAAHKRSEGAWIIHLDEETLVDELCVLRIAKFAVEEDTAVAAGKQSIQHYGQGINLYSRLGTENWFTTMADLIRVGDDFGRYRLFYSGNSAMPGIHGSFVVASQTVEETVDFNLWPKESITEDAYWAFYAMEQGITPRPIDAYMYERSPFTIRDFVEQRRRWCSGLMLLGWEEKIKLQTRWVLKFLLSSQLVMPINLFTSWMYYFYPTGISGTFAFWVGVAQGVNVLPYIIGFLHSYDVADFGNKWAYCAMAMLQSPLSHLYAPLEMAGFTYGLVAPTLSEFYVVDKRNLLPGEEKVKGE